MLMCIAIVLEFYRAFDDQDIDKAFTLLTADFVAHLTGEYQRNYR